VRETVVAGAQTNLIGHQRFTSGNGATVISAGTAASGFTTASGFSRIGANTRVIAGSGTRFTGSGVFEQSETIKIYEPPQDVIAACKAPDVVVAERIEEVPYIYEKEVVVEVPEIQHHKSIIHIPKYIEELVDVPYEVDQLHVREEIEVKGEWREEVFDKIVPVVSVKEVEQGVLISSTEYEEEIVEYPVPVPSVERIIQRPAIEVKANVLQLKGSTDMKVYEPEYVEDSYTVQVPRVVPVPKEETDWKTTEIVVPQIRRVEKVVEVPELQVIDKIVDIPVVNIEKTIWEVPRFVQSGEVLMEDGVGSPYFVAMQKLRRLRGLIAQAQMAKEEIRLQLTVISSEMTSAQTLIDIELEMKRQLEVQILSPPEPTCVELSAPSPSTITGSRYTDYGYKTETVVLPATPTSGTARRTSSPPAAVSYQGAWTGLTSSYSAGSYQRSTAGAMVSGGTVRAAGNLFNAIDTNHDGVISRSEFSKFAGGVVKQQGAPHHHRHGNRRSPSPHTLVRPSPITPVYLY